jgi:ATP:ADP antiporter, AAA family
MPTRKEVRTPRQLFFLVSGLIVAHQVAGKAVRDGLFLSHFSTADLPKIVIGAALFSVLLGLGFARLLSRNGPLRLVPAAFSIGSLLHIVEFALLHSGGQSLQGAVITLVYLHLVGFGAILLSGFWSVASEVFDPREAKREFGRITGAGTIGGIAGGLLAERGAALFGVESLLLLLAVLHLVAWFALRSELAKSRTRSDLPTQDNPWKTARDAFRHAPFLFNLGGFILLGTVTATLLDYLFKSGAAVAYGAGPQLTRYFALFYTASQVLTFAVQTFLTPAALQRFGLGRTIQWHPTAVAVGAGASLFAPQFVMIPLARAMELVMRGSFLRSSYELFFTPVPPREKRATKMLIDVSCDRMGDMVGACILQMVLLLGPSRAITPVLVITASLAAVSFWIAKRMDAAYSKVLEHGLLSRAVALNGSDIQDSTTLAALLHSTTIRSKLRPSTQPLPVIKSGVQDPVLLRLADLRSGSIVRIRAALAPDQPFDATVVPFAIRLLAWKDSFEWARAFLLLHAHRAVGQLVDALLDPEQDFAVRRRIPQILAYTSSQRAVAGLISALADTRFEIRFNASRGLEFLHRMSDDLDFDREAMLAAVDRELSNSRSIWQGHTLLDHHEASHGQYWFLDDVLRDRANKSLEHVFSLLAVHLPLDPLKVAFRALHGDDAILRGLALEFLESHLSPSQVSLLRYLLEPATSTAPAHLAGPLTLCAPGGSR